MNDFTDQFLSNGTHSAESTLANEVAYTQLTSSYANPSTSNMLQQIYDQLQKLNKNVEDLNERVIKLEADNTIIQTRILTEVIAQRKLVQGNKPRMLLPPKSFNKMEEIEKFEEELNNSAELCEQLDAEIKNYNISDPAKFLRTMWKKIFSDEIALKYSWKGTHTKKCVLSMAITTAMRSNNFCTLNI
ncbi:uncharacterized protein LOC133840144 [Drosophila sulfurigaster albostrigata]|uniref:uncharacterized protein LOC133840144 n=1 Tax=Drosophila sulfurigaster albostrigata TaxID=89887 RepID=UPI002D21C1EA|nr:uncharacterized protein LOC133840144 [Drosophila sulfurigaster albostrigata]